MALLLVEMLGKTLELLLVSMGLISTLSLVKNSLLPFSCHLLLSTLTCIRCFLSSPPSLILLLLINLIVLLIFASSAFSARRHHHTTTLTLLHHHLDDLHESPPPPPPPSPPRTTNDDLALIPQPHEIKTTTEDKWKDVFIHTDHHQNEQEDDTMEAKWKAISGGKEQKRKKKHLRKSETWDAPVHRLDSEEVLPTSPRWKELRKAETFNDAVSVMRRGGMIRRDPSMSLEELNQKVEAFIENFNNNMRLQRQESHQRFLDKINRQRI